MKHLLKSLIMHAGILPKSLLKSAENVASKIKLQYFSLGKHEMTLTLNGGRLFKPNRKLLDKTGL